MYNQASVTSALQDMQCLVANLRKFFTECCHLYFHSIAVFFLCVFVESGLEICVLDYVLTDI